MELKLSPSILAADFSKLGQDVERAENAGVKYMHYDVMDGSFVPNISYGAPIIKALKDKSKCVFDVHMMVVNPERYFQDMKDAGADIITIHQEATTHLDSAINMIKKMGLKAGVALNPATPISTLDCILPLLDMVLIMSVNPGFGGQKLIPYTLDKIKALKEIREEKGLSYFIGIDGGVNQNNVGTVIESGADLIVAGSAVFCPNENIEANVKGFLDILEG